MPNPLMRAGRQVTSDPVRDRQPITPIPESYEGENNPYRGTEQHGVIPMYQPLAPQQWEQGRPVTFPEAPAEEEPIAVRIVEESGRELNRMRTFGAYTGTTNNPPKEVLGKSQERRTVHLKHITDAATVWISHARETCNSNNGHPMQKGDEFTTNSQEAIYAWADAADPLTIYVRVEYSVKVE